MDTYALKTGDGFHFVTASNGGGMGGTFALATDRTQAGAWESFTIVVVDMYTRAIAIEAANGNYLSAVTRAASPANRPSRRIAFRLEPGRSSRSSRSPAGECASDFQREVRHRRQCGRHERERPHPHGRQADRAMGTVHDCAGARLEVRCFRGARRGWPPEPAPARRAVRGGVRPRSVNEGPRA